MAYLTFKLNLLFPCRQDQEEASEASKHTSTENSEVSKELQAIFEQVFIDYNPNFPEFARR